MFEREFHKERVIPMSVGGVNFPAAEVGATPGGRGGRWIWDGCSGARPADPTDPAVGWVRRRLRADAAQDLRAIHAATVQYAAENNGEMFYCFNSGFGGWADLWINTLADYLPPEANVTHSSGRNRVFYNGRVKANDRSIADYAPSENVIRENNNTWGDYPNTIAKRQGDPKSPAFFAVYCGGHPERISFNDFSKDWALRQRMLSEDSISESLYK